MTVTATPPINQYTGDGVQDTYAFTFRILKNEHLGVYVTPAGSTTSTKQVLGADYNLQNVTDSGGDVVFVNTTGNDRRPPAGSNVVLLRETPQSQETDYAPFDAFPAETHERALDKLTLIVQELGGGMLGISRFLALDPTTLQWDAEGLRIANVSDPVTDQQAATKKYVDDLVESGGDFNPGLDYTITGNWTFTGIVTHTANVQMNNSAVFRFQSSGGFSYQGIGVDGNDALLLGSASGSMNNLLLQCGTSKIIRVLHGTTDVANFVSAANGSFKIADTSGTLGNVAAVHKEQTFTGAQTFQKFVCTDQTPTFQAGSLALRMIDSTAGADEKNWRVQTISGDFQIRTRDDSDGPGSNAVSISRTGVSIDRIKFGMGATSRDCVDIIDRDNGGLLVYDRGGVAKKAGFRNPTQVSLSADYQTSQTDEGRCLRFTAAADITLNSLEAGTTFRIFNIAAGSRLLAGAGVASVNWFAGGQILTGTRTLAAGSVVEVYYLSPTNVYIFGNGLT